MSQAPFYCPAGEIIPPTMPPWQRVELFDRDAARASRDPRVADIANDLHARLAAQLGRVPTDAEFAQWAMDRLHDLVEYRPDPENLEVVYSPEFTLVAGLTSCGAAQNLPTSPLTDFPKGAGDCEDMAKTYAALLLSRGLEARTKWYDQPGAALNHVSALVKINGAWVPAETTLQGARLGEDPYQALARLGNGHNLQRIYG